MQDFLGKTAVVTGAASGIGRALALRAASEGMQVVILDIQSASAIALADEINSAGGHAKSFHLDVTNRDEIRNVAPEIESCFGSVDLLFNNAGVTTFRDTQALTDADWDWDLAVNLRGAIDVTRAFLPGMLARHSGSHIVFTASVAGLIAEYTSNIVPYTVSKFGLVAYAEALQHQLAQSHVGISILCPGGVATDIALSAERRPPAFGGPIPGDHGVHRRAQSAAISPELVALICFRAVSQRQPYIFTTAAPRMMVSARFERIASAFDHVADFPDVVT